MSSGFQLWLRRFVPGTVRRHRILRGPLRGKLIRAAWRNYPRAILGSAEPALVRWLLANVRSGETWLDVGAHYGYTTLAICSSVGPDGRVFAFEPSVRTAGFLAATKLDNRLEQLVVVPVGLGDQPPLHGVRVGPMYRDMLVLGSDLDKQPPADSANETIFLTALDAIWEGLSNGVPAVSGIKMDVQGMEASAIRGMRRLLREHRPRLVVEYHAYAGLHELHDALESAGYESHARTLDDGMPTEQLDHGENYEFRPR